MKARVTRIKDPAAVLKDLEHHIKAPDSLRKGREFRNFSLRPRELLANLLICFAGNFEEGTDCLSVCTDPLGGDGLIYNANTGDFMMMEHVFIPPSADTRLPVEHHIAHAVALKNAKGAAYARNKDLLIFSEAIGKWEPNRVAAKLIGFHHFENIWIVHLDQAGEEGYSYFLAWLEVGHGANAPVWRIAIDPSFKAWQVERVQ